MQVEFGLVEQESAHGMPAVTKLGIRSEEELGLVALTLVMPRGGAVSSNSPCQEANGVPDALHIAVTYYVKPSVARAIGSALMGAAAELRSA